MQLLIFISFSLKDHFTVIERGGTGTNKMNKKNRFFLSPWNLSSSWVQIFGYFDGSFLLLKEWFWVWMTLLSHYHNSKWQIATEERSVSVQISWKTLKKNQNKMRHSSPLPQTILNSNQQANQCHCLSWPEYQVTFMILGHILMFCIF